MTATSSSSSIRMNRPPDDSSSGSPPSPESVSVASRTCECLTQTLWCHGCGNSVGYMIVVPCVRCTSSMTVTNRTTNGHRFVFYSSEIAASERYYISGECGIISPAYSPRLPTSPPTSSSGLTPPNPTRTSSVTASPSRVPSTPPSRRDVHTSLLDSATDSPRHSSPSSESVLDSPLSLSDSASSSSMPPLIPATPSYRERMRSSSISSSHIQEPARLNSGDNLYWHHLVRTGEIPAVADEPNARNPRSTPAEEIVHDEYRQAEHDSAIKSEAPRRKRIPMAGR